MAPFGRGGGLLDRGRGRERPRPTPGPVCLERGSFSPSFCLLFRRTSSRRAQNRVGAAVGLLSAFLTWTILGKRSSATQVVPIDKVGLVLLVLGVGALQILLD
ncbi:MAG: hypothetical protein J0H26_07990, partial [Alphaproteobacteria bacterium]|nr:hypothetical protein [Alphaproteobacteria bacterium]